MEGNLPDISDIAWRLRLPEIEIIDAIQELKHFLSGDCINMISERYQAYTPETETETETDVVSTRKRNSAFPKPDDVNQDLWDAFIKHRKTKKAPITEIAIDGIRRECEKAGWQINDAIREIIERNWQSFKAQWVVNQSFNAKPSADPFEGAI